MTSIELQLSHRNINTSPSRRVWQLASRAPSLMLRTRIAVPAPTTCRPCRRFASTSGPRSVPTLPDASIETFRRDAFDAATPALLPRKHFADMPAVHKWFTNPSSGHTTLNTAYLSRFGATLVPLEITNNDHFARVEQSLSFFLECVKASASHYPAPSRNHRYFSSYVPGARAIRRTSPSNDFFSASSMTTPTAQVYLAQAPLADLPRALAQDVPTPEFVTRAGKGDVYDSSVWLGQAPTYTPLHRDPNPNLFVQLAGRKVVRLCRPEVGLSVFARVQERVGGSASATMRGEEMMQGAEKKALEEEVWTLQEGSSDKLWEAKLQAGDGLFIPKGWWHSVKGVGKGFTGSVNWWFR